MGRPGRNLIRALREANSTMDLYKNESLWKRISMTIYTCDFFDPIFDTYYSILSFFANCKRLIEYAPLVWKHRTWDHGFVLRFNVKLYEDLYKGCYEKGHHVYTKAEARKLRTVIGLLKRLEADDYSEGHSKYLEKKYGESDFYFPQVTDEKGRTYTTMKNRREDNMTPKQFEAYNKERKALWKLEDYLRKQDFKLLGKYIEKYSNKWWD